MHLRNNSRSAPLALASCLLLLEHVAASEPDKRFLDAIDSPARAFWNDALSKPLTVKAKKQPAIDVLRFVLFQARVNYAVQVGRKALPETLEAETVTLDLEKTSIRQILWEIHLQTGWKFGFERNGSQLVVR